MRPDYGPDTPAGTAAHKNAGWRAPRDLSGRPDSPRARKSVGWRAARIFVVGQACVVGVRSSFLPMAPGEAANQMGLSLGRPRAFLPVRYH